MNAPAPNQSPVVFPSNTSAKISSKQIAESTGKVHRHVMRDVKCLIDQGALRESNFGLSFYDVPMPNGAKPRKQPMYLLDFHATMTLITGYNAVLRSKVIARWMELERESAEPQANNQPSTEPSKPTSLLYRSTVINIAYDNEGNILFDLDGIFKALGYSRQWCTYPWAVSFCCMKTIIIKDQDTGEKRTFLPVPALRQLLKITGKVEKFQLVRWIDNAMAKPQLYAAPVQQPIQPSPSMLIRIVNGKNLDPGYKYLLAIDDNGNPSIISRLSVLNSTKTVNFSGIPGNPTFETALYCPIDPIIDSIEREAFGFTRTR